MQLELHYTKMWENSMRKFYNNAFDYDLLVNSPADRRFGVSLVAKPSDKVKKNMLAMLEDLRSTEPDQYYYPYSDIHITILSIISCYDGFELTHIEAEDYVHIIQSSLKGIRPFPVYFKGITASPSCIIVQGFPSDELEMIRNSLRNKFKNTKLEIAIDTRYEIHTAHSTVIRFTRPLKQPGAFIEKLGHYRNHDFGSIQVDELEFVFNDWYQRHLDENILAKFDLKNL